MLEKQMGRLDKRCGKHCKRWNLSPKGKKVVKVEKRSGKKKNGSEKSETG